MKIFTKHTSTLLCMAVGTQCLAILYSILTTLAQFHNVVNVHRFRVKQFMADSTFVLLTIRYFPTILFGNGPFRLQRQQDRTHDLQLTVGTGIRVPR
jgi:hypothetical protein